MTPYPLLSMLDISIYILVSASAYACYTILRRKDAENRWLILLPFPVMLTAISLFRIVSHHLGFVDGPSDLFSFLYQSAIYAGIIAIIAITHLQRRG